MPSSLPPHLAPASKLLGQLQSALGTGARVQYTNECLHVVYAKQVSDIASVLVGAGVVIDANLSLPGFGQAANEEMIIGHCEGAHFMARSHTDNKSPQLEVHIYANDGKKEDRSNRLDSIYLMADALFSTHDSSDNALLSYIARRLCDQANNSATTEFAAGLNDLLASYLKSTLPQLDPRLTVKRG